MKREEKISEREGELEKMKIDIEQQRSYLEEEERNIRTK